MRTLEQIWRDRAARSARFARFAADRMPILAYPLVTLDGGTVIPGFTDTGLGGIDEQTRRYFSGTIGVR